MSATELLNAASKTLMEEAQAYLADADFYLLLVKTLPPSLPCPDEIHPNHLIDIPELIYRVDKGEDVETLRLQVALTFGAAYWWGIFNADENIFEIRAEASRGTCRLRLRILNVFSGEYYFNPYRREGPLIIGQIKSRRFHAWGITREEIPSRLFLQRAQSSNAAIPRTINDAQVLKRAAIILETRGLDGEKSNIPSEEGN